MNVPRMMRPGMSNPNPNANAAMINPNNSLRHLLQPQGQVITIELIFHEM